MYRVRRCVERTPYPVIIKTGQVHHFYVVVLLVLLFYFVLVKEQNSFLFPVRCWHSLYGNKDYKQFTVGYIVFGLIDSYALV